MKLAVELPVSLLNLVYRTDYDFVIASYYVTNKEYAAFYQSIKERRFMILDNGAFETGQSIDFNVYIQIVKELHPDTVVLPDTVNNARATVEQSDIFLKASLSQIDVPNFMGVLQGESINDYMYCLEYYIRQSRNYNIRTIGIPYHLFYRPTLLRKTNIIDLCKEYGLLIHILGLPNPYEIVDLKKFGEIITHVDTSLPISTAFAGNNLNETWPLGGRVAIDASPSTVICNKALRNILFLQDICKRQY